MVLPIFISDSQPMTLMQTRWAQQLEPLIQNPSLKTNILKNVSLVTGSNTVDHMLGRKLQGWRIVRLRANETVFDTQDSNPRTELTLLLTASGPVTIDLEVF